MRVSAWVSMGGQSAYWWEHSVAIWVLWVNGVAGRRPALPGHALLLAQDQSTPFWRIRRVLLGRRLQGMVESQHPEATHRQSQTHYLSPGSKGWPPSGTKSNRGRSPRWYHQQQRAPSLAGWPAEESHHPHDITSIRGPQVPCHGCREPRDPVLPPSRRATELATAAICTAKPPPHHHQSC